MFNDFFDFWIQTHLGYIKWATIQICTTAVQVEKGWSSLFEQNHSTVCWYSQVGAGGQSKY